jgi:branched-chain amino acid transport system permease protein
MNPFKGMNPALRDAGLSALVAVGLFGPMIGLRTEAIDGPLGLVPQPALLILAVAAVFAGRLAIWSWRQEPPAKQAYQTNRRFAEALTRSGKYVAPLLLAVAVGLPFLGGRYEMDVGILVMTYVMLGWGLNIVVGLAGLLDLGYVAFYAVGAYSYALLAQTFGLGFWTCLPLAGLLAGTWGVILGFPVLRLRGDYLAIVTLAFGEIIRIILLNAVEITGGPNGISNIPRPTLFGLVFNTTDDPGTFAHFVQSLGWTDFEASPSHRVIFLYYVILALALLTNWVTIRLRRVALGRAWEALREDEIACRSLGIDVTVTKLTAFAMGATFGGLAGAFFATRAAFISPESFTFIESAIVLAIVVLGGLGSQLGVALAAVVMIGGIEVFRDLAEYRMLIFGLALVVMMVLRPRGLVSGRTPSVALGVKREIAAELVTQGRG